MLKRCSPSAVSSGFTIVELMIALAVLGVLVMVALPSFRQMLRNYEMRGVAESVANGLQRARAESVSRNTSVQFVLGTGTSWTVDYVTKPVPTDPPLDTRSSSDRAPNTTLAAVAADLSTAATTITYNNLGQVIANADTSPSLAQVSFSATEGSQTLRVVVGAGGSARVCDPSLPSGNARAC